LVEFNINAFVLKNLVNSLTITYQVDITDSNINESFNDIWNNSIYSFSRKLFNFTIINTKQVNSICSECKNFKKRVH